MTNQSNVKEMTDLLAFAESRRELLGRMPTVRGLIVRAVKQRDVRLAIEVVDIMRVTEVVTRRSS